VKYSGPCDEQSPHKWLYIAGGCSPQGHFNDKRQIHSQKNAILTSLWVAALSWDHTIKFNIHDCIVVTQFHHSLDGGNRLEIYSVHLLREMMKLMIS
jgi:hypothetical protein